jgi:pSer/pThr/pTyr-binding forkhead associated (FHA) protein
MLSLKRFCAVSLKQCCFVSNENSRSESPQKDESIINNNDITNQLENQSISDKNSKSSKTLQKKPSVLLKLEVLDSQSLEIGSIFLIDSEGLRGGSRAKDSSVLIGSDSSNDIVLSSHEKGVGGRHLMLKFDVCHKNCFGIRDLGEGMGTFIRLDKRLSLKCNNIISFGDSHMIVLIDYSDGSRITLKFIDGPRKDQSQYFLLSAFHINDSPVTIGRMADCSIRFDDSSLSRYHCLINYESGWFIKDGDGVKSSTNGTWLYCEEFVDVYTGMVFKAAETLFKVCLRQVELDSFN